MSEDLEWFLGPKDLEPYTSGVVLIPPEEGWIEETGRLPNIPYEEGTYVEFDYDDISYLVIRVVFEWGHWWRKDRRFQHITLLRDGYVLRKGIDINRWGTYKAKDDPLLLVCRYCGTQFSHIDNASLRCPSCMAL